jgi:hypothetical protein
MMHVLPLLGSLRPLRCCAALALLVALGGGSLPARADEVSSAEHDRIADEMEKLVQRQIWTGVEKKFQELEKLGQKMTQRDYLNGAYAARELGDVRLAYERLQAAARIEGSKEIVDWLWDIDRNYGMVELLSVPNRATILEPNELPFDPNHRKAVEAAIKVAKSDGAFHGMLPRGEYSFGGQKFQVEPGVSVHIEVSPRVRRQGLIDPVIVYRSLPGSAPVNTAPAPGVGPESPPPSEGGTSGTPEQE